VRAAVAAQKHWTPVQPHITCFETQLQLKVWKLELRVVVFRKQVHHESPRNYQLDLFSPMTATSSTRQWPLTCPWPRAHCGISWLAAARKRRPLPSSRENSGSTPSPQPLPSQQRMAAAVDSGPQSDHWLSATLQPRHGQTTHRQAHLQLLASEHENPALHHHQPRRTGSPNPRPQSPTLFPQCRHPSPLRSSP
jgi:hypothetical protein